MYFADVEMNAILSTLGDKPRPLSRDVRAQQPMNDRHVTWLLQIVFDQVMTAAIFNFNDVTEEMYFKLRRFQSL